MPNYRRLMLLPPLCVILILQPRPTSGQALDESFRSDIQKLLEVTGAAQVGAQAASLHSEQLLSGLRKSQPVIPDRALALARQVLDAEFAKAFVGPDGLTEQMVSIYAKHFTHDDIRGLLAFYSTNLGKKTIALMPIVFQESAAAAQQ